MDAEGEERALEYSSSITFYCVLAGSCRFMANIEQAAILAQQIATGQSDCKNDGKRGSKIDQMRTCTKNYTDIHPPVKGFLKFH